MPLDFLLPTLSISWESQFPSHHTFFVLLTAYCTSKFLQSSFVYVQNSIRRYIPSNQRQHDKRSRYQMTNPCVFCPPPFLINTPGYTWEKPRIFSPYFLLVFIFFVVFSTKRGLGHVKKNSFRLLISPLPFLWDIFIV